MKKGKDRSLILLVPRLGVSVSKADHWCRRNLHVVRETCLLHHHGKSHYFNHVYSDFPHHLRILYYLVVFITGVNVMILDR